MVKRKSEIIRVDPEFRRLIKDIPIQRIRLGKDKFMRSTAEITRAFARHKDMQRIIKDTLEASE